MAGSRLRDDAVSIFNAGVEAVDPREAVAKHLARSGDELRIGSTRYDLGGIRAIRVVGMGKASAAMAPPIQELLHDRQLSGVVTVKYGHARPLRGIRVVEAGHPVPDAAGLEGAREIMKILDRSGPDDLVLCLISGGGSALSPAPVKGLTLGHKQAVTRCLLECGATIHETNALRKHLSLIKGGRLARLAQPSRLVSLILSDVIGDDLDTIASGPTVPDRSTYYDCLRILNKYGIADVIPSEALRILEAGARGELPETPKEGDPAFLQTQNVVVGSNAAAVAAARARAEELGYNAMVLSSFVDGETREVARVHAAVAKEIRRSGNPVPPPACVISGGETTVTLRGTGKGGRNQEFALAAALAIEGMDGVEILSAGTDGTDGPTDAAGAFATGSTVERGRSVGLDAGACLDNNDSHGFFEPLGDLLRTGPTFTNVMDLRVILVS